MARRAQAIDADEDERQVKVYGASLVAAGTRPGPRGAVAAVTPIRMHTYPLALLPTAFALHLAWEYVQCQPYFTHGSLPTTTVTMLLATLGDVALTAIAYVATALIARSWAWPLIRWDRRVWISLMVSAVILALLVEWHALGTGRWGYTAAALLVPGTAVGLLPILQLVVLFPLSFGLARMVVGVVSRENSRV